VAARAVCEAYLLQRGRAFEGAESSTLGAEVRSRPKRLQRGRAFEGAESEPHFAPPLHSLTLQRGRAFEGAESSAYTYAAVGLAELQRGRAFEGAESAPVSSRVISQTVCFNGAALLRARREPCDKTLTVPLDSVNGASGSLLMDCASSQMRWIQGLLAHRQAFAGCERLPGFAHHLGARMI
jgi:hypothetical protein